MIGLTTVTAQIIARVTRGEERERERERCRDCRRFHPRVSLNEEGKRVSWLESNRHVTESDKAVDGGGDVRVRPPPPTGFHLE